MVVTPDCCAIERYVVPGTAGDQGKVLLLWTGPQGPGRNNLIVRVSRDDGQSFGVGKRVAKEPAAYSDLTVLKDRTVGILWERGNYKYLTFTRMQREFFDPAQDE